MRPEQNNDDPLALLPWYLNGTLSPEESARVENWLEQEGTSAQQELTLLNQLRGHLQADQAEGPGELGWRRLQSQLKAEPKVRSISRWYRPALAAALAVIVLQGGLLGQQWWGQEADWQTLSGKSVTKAQLQVIFQPQATAFQIRELLQTQQLQLVDGPSAAGLYRLRLTADANTSVAQQLKLLSQADGVVRHVAAE